MNNSSECNEWWCEKTGTLITLEVVVILICVVGCMGNLLTLLTIITSNLRHSVNCILVGNLSVAGFIYCLIILPVQAVIYHRHALEVPSGLCTFMGFVRFTLTGVIMVTLADIALYRLLKVVYYHKYMCMSKNRHFFSTIFLCWLIPMIFTFPPAVEWWGAYHYHASLLTCTLDDKKDRSNKIAVVTAGFIFPCAFIICCYSLIGYTVFKSFRRYRNSSRSKSFRISAIMLCIFILFFIGSFPYVIYTAVDKDYSYPIHHIWTTMFAWLMYCINPIVYTIMDTNFRSAYKKLLCCRQFTLLRRITVDQTSSV
ncbi:hypothetical protein DPMN_090290 [Dreissena polymorpha]|uniref:G-protein coupled receptors family 1 profile domain-containing protein n=1 Tax=Dreissena polymorpha TaxID=45954 RepID=A0A9D4KYG5_DREPO|nr:hypothetical protein DPMN_090290 [Dreissena polymorpha]